MNDDQLSLIHQVVKQILGYVPEGTPETIEELQTTLDEWFKTQWNCASIAPLIPQENVSWPTPPTLTQREEDPQINEEYARYPRAFALKRLGSIPGGVPSTWKELRERGQFLTGRQWSKK